MPTGLNITPDITDAIPALLSARTASQTAVANGTPFDVSVAGVGFFLACDEQTPVVRQSAQITKDQFDSSKEAGEQSLDQWWLRSQTSWHQGSGIRFYEPGSDETSQYRSAETVGVDVWTRDQASLLHSMSQLGGSGSPLVTGAVLPNGKDALFAIDNGTLTRYTFTDGVPDAGTEYTGSGGTLPVIAGRKVLSGHDTGIASGSITGSALTDLWTQTSGTVPTPYWVKDRIIATQGSKVFELTLAGGDLSAETAVFDHPDPDWSWTTVVDSPAGILLAGESCGRSSIYLISLTQPSDGSTPELAPPVLVATLPLGETVRAMTTYLGTYIGLGTTAGIRVGTLDEQGLAYGPLTVETTSPVLSLTARGSSLYGAVSGQIQGGSGAVRVGLEQPVTGLRFPWAWDAQTHQVGAATSIAVVGSSDLIAVTVEGKGLYVQSPTDYEETGTITTGRIRFATVEPKVFQSVDVKMDTTPGESVTVEATTDTDSTYTLGTIASPATLGFKLEVPLEYLSLKFTLRRGSTASKTPILGSWQIKALPKPAHRQRLIQYPLQCYDSIIPSRSQVYGGQDSGFAWTALQALEGLEDKYVTVQVTDHTIDESYAAVIEQVEFHRTARRASDGRGNFGGMVLLTVRKL